MASQESIEKRRLYHRLAARKHRANNLEALRAYQSEWARKHRAANPEKSRAQARARRANQKPEQRARKQAYQLVYERAYRAENPEKQRAKGLRYYQRHRAEVLERGRRYKASHPQKIRVSKRNRRRIYGETQRAADRARWAALPPEVRQARSRAYNQALKISTQKRRVLDPAWYAIVQEKRRAKGDRRRAYLAGAPVNDLTVAQWREIKAAYRYRCVYCGTKPDRLTMDHITPLSRGGAHTKHNVVPACRSCNSRKHVGPVLKPVQPLLL